MITLRLNSVTEKYQKYFFKAHPCVLKMTWKEQNTSILNDMYSQADSYSNVLNEAGIESLDVVCDVPSIWAKANECEGMHIRSTRDFADWLIGLYKPDYVWVTNAYPILDSAWVSHARSISPKSKFLVWCGIKVDDTSVISGYDRVITSNTNLLDYYKNSGFDSYRIPYAFDRRIIDALPTDPIKRNITFIGQLLAGSDMHDDRVDLISAISTKVPISCFCPQRPPHKIIEVLKYMLITLGQKSCHTHITKRLASNIPCIRIGANGGEPPKSWNLRNRNILWEDPVYGIQYYKSLQSSLVTLNAHIGAAGHNTGNIRLYESTGVGTCLLTDYKADLGEFFDIGTEVVAYYNLDDAVEKAQYLYNNPDVACNIGRNAQRRVLNDHLYKNRVDLIIEALTKWD